MFVVVVVVVAMKLKYCMRMTTAHSISFPSFIGHCIIILRTHWTTWTAIGNEWHAFYRDSTLLLLRKRKIFVCFRYFTIEIKSIRYFSKHIFHSLFSKGRLTSIGRHSKAKSTRKSFHRNWNKCPWKLAVNTMCMKMLTARLTTCISVNRHNWYRKRPR